MQKTITTFILLFSLFSFSQEITIKGIIKDNKNRGIQNASVSLLNESDDFLGYAFTDENGLYSISFNNTKNHTIKIEISCLGYKKITQIINSTNQNQNYQLEEKIESLQEVVVESSKKIRINQDTTYIKVASFGNKTEQTVEDILKKLPIKRLHNS